MRTPGWASRTLLLLPHVRQDDAVLGEPKLTDAAGIAHDWRAELVAPWPSGSKPDGSWVNPADRFMEGDPNLVTAYALLAPGVHPAERHQ